MRYRSPRNELVNGQMPAKSSKSSATAARSGAASGLSIVVPIFNEAKGLAALHERIAGVARALKAKRGLRTEVVYVDDGSTDSTNQIAHSLVADPFDVQVVTLSRNFGKEAALLAGLDHARLGAVLFMDGDGQHPPDLVDTLVARWLDDGYDVVYTAKANRENEPWLRRASVHWFYALINLGARQKIPGTPAISACCRRARRRRCGRCRNAAASSRDCRAGSDSSRHASITNRPSGRTA